MRLLVLAGGFGARLKTVVTDYPKALAPIGNVPFLQLQIEHWLTQGIREFTFLLHYQAYQIIAFLQSEMCTQFKDCKVDWVIEPMPMDTGGALAHAIKTLALKGDVLITNADTWLGSGIYELMQTPTPAMAVVSISDVSRYGQVYFDNSHRVSAFGEKNGQCIDGWINAGLYRFSTKLFSNWDNQPFSLERKILATLVQNGRLTAVPLQTDFIDIGVPVDYYRFCRWVATGRHGPL